MLPSESWGCETRHHEGMMTCACQEYQWNLPAHTRSFTNAPHDDACHQEYNSLNNCACHGGRGIISVLQCVEQLHNCWASESWIQLAEQLNNCTIVQREQLNNLLMHVMNTTRWVRGMIIWCICTIVQLFSELYSWHASCQEYNSLNNCVQLKDRTAR